jgi:hypothetical protein
MPSQHNPFLSQKNSGLFGLDQQQEVTSINLMVLSIKICQKEIIELLFTTVEID